MSKFVILFALIAIAQAAVIDDYVPILKSVSEVNDDGGYVFMFEGGDGSFREEKAVKVNVGTEDEHLAITGSYKYIDVDGHPVEVHYTADQHGFVPSGTNIPDKITQAARAAVQHVV